jgi:chromate transporter
VLAVAWAYARFGHLPAVASVLYGVKPVMIAVVLQALWSLGRSAIKDWFLGVLAAAALAASLLHANEVAVLACAGLAGAARRRLWKTPALFPLLSTAMASPLATPHAARIFLSFAKIGSVLYGSGYVLLAFLRAEFVQRLGWLSEGQLLDAIAVGQINPGPVFTTATFIGYLLSAWSGALAAVSALVLLRWRPNSLWLVLGGATVGALVRLA